MKNNVEAHNSHFILLTHTIAQVTINTVNKMHVLNRSFLGCLWLLGNFARMLERNLSLKSGGFIRKKYKNLRPDLLLVSHSMTRPISFLCGKKGGTDRQVLVVTKEGTGSNCKIVSTSYCSISTFQIDV